MNLLSVENIARRFGEKVLFERLQFGISKGEKVALVAPNGTGKSTLFRILAGIDNPDDGVVVRRNGLNIAFLEQDPVFPQDLTVEEYIRQANTGVLSLLHEYETLTRNTDAGRENTARIMELSHQLDELQAWDYDRHLIQLLNIFRITNTRQRISELSGGQKKRLSLAVTLSTHHDFLLLDEPTNHLDISMTEWLEEYLSDGGITVLMVTHDRYFLDRICNRIMELNAGKLFEWKGNYSYYLEKRALLDEVLEAEADKARNLMRKELDWMRRMPKARGTKAKYRVDAFYNLQEKAAYRKQERSLKLEVTSTRLGGKILELKNVSKSYANQKLIDQISYVFSKGERVGVIGENGVGKSTFLNLLAGQVQPDEGFVDKGETVKIGYYTQEGIRLNEDKRVIEVLKEVAEFVEMPGGRSLSASQLLQHFLFTPEQQYTYVSKLSGGERRRLHLMMVLMTNPNFLILDEPTNDLDLFTLNRLEEFLTGFTGCLILVSHDRYFIDKLADHLFVMEGDGRIMDFVGTWSEYREQKEAARQQEVKEEKEKRVTNTVQVESKPDVSAKRKLTYKEKLELESLDKLIPELENRIFSLQESLQEASADYEAYHKLSADLDKLRSELDAKSLRWLELSELS